MTQQEQHDVERELGSVHNNLADAENRCSELLENVAQQALTIESLEKLVDDLRGGPKGPYSHCTQCGRAMVWNYFPDGVWLCPCCTLRNLDSMRDGWRLFWSYMAKEFPEWRRLECSPGFIEGRIRDAAFMTLGVPSSSSASPASQPAKEAKP